MYNILYANIRDARRASPRYMSNQKKHPAWYIDFHPVYISIRYTETHAVRLYMVMKSSVI